jgi:hypothetical protein
LLIVFNNQNTLIHMICSLQNIPQLACRIQMYLKKEPPSAAADGGL